MHRIESDIRDVGAIHYGKALHRLRQNIQDPQFCQDPANLAAALMLGRYEVSMHQLNVRQANMPEDLSAQQPRWMDSTRWWIGEND